MIFIILLEIAFLVFLLYARLALYKFFFSLTLYHLWISLQNRKENRLKGLLSKEDIGLERVVSRWLRLREFIPGAESRHLP